MERINSKRRERSEVVNRIIDSITSSLGALSLQQQRPHEQKYIGGGGDGGGVEKHEDVAYSSPPSYSAFSHGSPQTALHPSMTELFILPFPSICFASIDGDEMMYCNRICEKKYLTAEKANRRLLQDCHSPRDIMFE